MPTYEYVCDAGHESETRQSIEADALEVCPEDDCDAPAQRQISTGGGLISGTGGGSGPADSGGGTCSPSGFT